MTNSLLFKWLTGPASEEFIEILLIVKILHAVVKFNYVFVLVCQEEIKDQYLSTFCFLLWYTMNVYPVCTVQCTAWVFAKVLDFVVKWCFFML